VGKHLASLGADSGKVMPAAPDKYLGGIVGKYNDEIWQA
jgi:hypothetical protein